jgi:hypothetical protein
MASQKAAVPVSKRRPSKKSIIYQVFFCKRFSNRSDQILPKVYFRLLPSFLKLQPKLKENSTRNFITNIQLTSLYYYDVSALNRPGGVVNKFYEIL